MSWTIQPLLVGVFTGQEQSNIMYGTGHGTKLRNPSVMWLISDGSTAIVLDTGISDPEHARSVHGAVIERTAEQEPAAALALAGVAASDVQTVVLSHLHWDHASNNHVFPNARFIIQRAELEYAIAPLPAHARYFEAPSAGMQPRWLETADRFDIIEGDRHLADGLEIMFLPGHTPGLQGVLVETTAGQYMVASDCVSRYDSWQGRPPGQWIPSGIFVDLEVYYRSLARVADVADYVLPAHDMAVFDQEIYP
jgi:N-acyl homoserine lactone hydrolase